MSFSKLRRIRISKPVFPVVDDRTLSENALQSLRDYRRDRCANRQMPCQRKAA